MCVTNIAARCCFARLLLRNLSAVACQSVVNVASFSCQSGVNVNLLIIGSVMPLVMPYRSHLVPAWFDHCVCLYANRETRRSRPTVQ